MLEMFQFVGKVTKGETFFLGLIIHEVLWLLHGCVPIDLSQKLST